MDWSPAVKAAIVQGLADKLMELFAAAEMEGDAKGAAVALSVGGPASLEAGVQKAMLRCYAEFAANAEAAGDVEGAAAAAALIEAEALKWLPLTAAEEAEVEAEVAAQVEAAVAAALLAHQ